MYPLKAAVYSISLTFSSKRCERCNYVLPIQFPLGLNHREQKMHQLRQGIGRWYSEIDQNLAIFVLNGWVYQKNVAMTWVSLPQHPLGFQRWISRFGGRREADGFLWTSSRSMDFLMGLLIVHPPFQMWDDSGMLVLFIAGLMDWFGTCSIL